MTCRDVTDFLDAFVANDLAPEVRGTFERHLGGCVNCQHFLQQYEQTVAAGKCACDNEHVEIPEDLVKAILAAIREG
jgi:anti-sigma factor RsiW